MDDHSDSFEDVSSSHSNYSDSDSEGGVQINNDNGEMGEDFGSEDELDMEDGEGEDDIDMKDEEYLRSLMADDLRDIDAHLRNDDPPVLPPQFQNDDPAIDDPAHPTIYHHLLQEEQTLHDYQDDDREAEEAPQTRNIFRQAQTQRVEQHSANASDDEDDDGDHDPLPSDDEDMPEPATERRRRGSAKMKFKDVPIIRSTYTLEDEFEKTVAAPSKELYNAWSARMQLNYECGIHPDNPRREELVRELRREIAQIVSALKDIKLDKKNLDGYNTKDRYKLLATCQYRLRELWNWDEDLVVRFVKAYLEDLWHYSKRKQRKTARRNAATSSAQSSSQTITHNPRFAQSSQSASTSNRRATAPTAAASTSAGKRRASAVAADPPSNKAAQPKVPTKKAVKQTAQPAKAQQHRQQQPQQRPRPQQQQQQNQHQQQQEQQTIASSSKTGKMSRAEKAAIAAANKATLDRLLEESRREKELKALKVQAQVEADAAAVSAAAAAAATATATATATNRSKKRRSSSPHSKRPKAAPSAPAGVASFESNKDISDVIATSAKVLNAKKKSRSSASKEELAQHEKKLESQAAPEKVDNQASAPAAVVKQHDSLQGVILNDYSTDTPMSPMPKYTPLSRAFYIKESAIPSIYPDRFKKVNSVVPPSSPPIVRNPVTGQMTPVNKRSSDEVDRVPETPPTIAKSTTSVGSNGERFEFQIKNGPLINIKRCSSFGQLITKLEDHFEFDTLTDILMYSVEGSKPRALCENDSLDDMYEAGGAGKVIEVYNASAENEFESPGSSKQKESVRNPITVENTAHYIENSAKGKAFRAAIQKSAKANSAKVDKLRGEVQKVIQKVYSPKNSAGLVDSAESIRSVLASKSSAKEKASSNSAPAHSVTSRGQSSGHSQSSGHKGKKGGANSSGSAGRNRDPIHQTSVETARQVQQRQQRQQSQSKTPGSSQKSNRFYHNNPRNQSSKRQTTPTPAPVQKQKGVGQAKPNQAIEKGGNRPVRKTAQAVQSYTLPDNRKTRAPGATQQAQQLKAGKQTAKKREEELIDKFKGR
ncbi:hypothetical protein BJ508DRAFT_324098 [Ascobolus immersus RN42]|uniref:Uncharacterized protein n=1 Tax=Ascobolus immersus RN42 TaxID=1160509 RepID=A0A3N4IGC4_ASCIM|nr:hypothetical protein BJ508DRAFT_324098 [Ascobolus immersus RN42]